MGAMSAADIDMWAWAILLTCAAIGAIVIIDSALRWWDAFKRLNKRNEK